MVFLQLLLFLILFFAISTVVQVFCEGLKRRWLEQVAWLPLGLSLVAVLFLFAGWNRWVTMILFAVSVGFTVVQSRTFHSLSTRFRRMW